MAHASSCSDPHAAPLVLVVDDSATMRRSVEMTLQSCGIRVVCAADGAQALTLLHQGLKPDLLLTDIVMPQVDGLTLIREARRLRPFMPIVALTTQGQQHLRDEGRAAGASAWLLKPTGGRELVGIVGRFITVPDAADALSAG